jgi:[acyl-carrier-protein] S-malonyltransferase
MKFAMVFPGQGSQSVGMLAGYGDSGAIRDTIAEASDILKQDVGKLVAEGPAEDLNSTVNTQPVMVTAGICAWRLWRELGGAEPAMAAGHSLGEYTALVVAGAIAFSDALPLVRLRAQAMQEAVPHGVGAMAAILGLKDDDVRAACRDSAQGQICEPVNWNAPAQVVIAGHADAVRRAMDAAKALGAKRAARLRDALSKISVKPPRIPVIHNVDAKSRTDPESIREALVTQADHSVLWVECVKEMAARGATHVFECGPGKVLAPLTKRIADGLAGLALSDRASVESGVQLSKGA